MKIHPAAAPRYRQLYDPSTAMLVAAGVGAASSVAGGIAQSKAADFNAAAASTQAQEAQGVAAEQAQQEAANTKRTIGEEVANAGASGVDPSQGSPLEVMSDTATQGELNRQLTLWQGSRQAEAMRLQAQLDSVQGSQAIQAGVAQAGGTLLTAGANYKYNAAPASKLPNSIYDPGAQSVAQLRAGFIPNY